MLNKNMHFICIILTMVMCISLLVTLDIYNMNKWNNLISTSSKRFYIINKESLKNNSVKFMFMNIKNTYLELMQIGDIYEENNKTSNNSYISNEQVNDEQIKEETKDDTKWRIKIPKISVDAPIKSGTTQDILATAVGHFEESKYWNGNVALAGHNRGYNCNFFEKLKYLDIGDRIFYSTENGTREYQVVLNKIIKQTDWTYIKNTEDNRLTLITCVENMYEYRRCIQAVEI